MSEFMTFSALLMLSGVSVMVIILAVLFMRNLPLFETMFFRLFSTSSQKLVVIVVVFPAPEVEAEVVEEEEELPSVPSPALYEKFTVFGK